MSETLNLAKVVLDVLKDYDYLTVTEKRLRKLTGESHVLGCCSANPSGRGHILVARQSYGAMEMTQLHELVHAYYNTLGVEASEEEVELTARDWRRMLYL